MLEAMNHYMKAFDSDPYERDVFRKMFCSAFEIGEYAAYVCAYMMCSKVIQSLYSKLTSILRTISQTAKLGNNPENYL